MTNQFVQIFLAELKFLHDFLIDGTKKWEILINLFRR